ncbi:hypothetical protein [Paludibaculum fermentans]|uniref:Uncharacterized protein n=1 Tax=Paludibaculum fermentans TaxID=1473598 RepID=A0A7S7SKZ2_PALFE|nr:hypothetical protein [Paludibaculum fermentans]QOY89692.1 hypothetical protein IRI77_06985 [Paludibaculum fermentans]
MARKPLILALCGVAAAAFLLGQNTFKHGPASSYPSVQTIGKLKIAAVRYESDTDTKQAFGKVNPNEYGILPVLLIFENAGDQTLLLDRMKVAYQYPGNEVLPMAATDLPYLMGVKRPGSGPKYPMPIPLPKKKNPLAAIELQTRAFGAKSIIKNDSASGFFYFETRYRKSAVIYITGIREAITNKEVFFAEVPLDEPTPE